MIFCRDYKIPDGKPANGYGYNDQCLNKEFAQKVRTVEFVLPLDNGLLVIRAKPVLNPRGNEAMRRTPQAGQLLH